MAQILNRGIIEIKVPNPVIFMFRPLVLLGKAIRPNLVPAALVVLVPLVQAGGNAGNQVSPFPALPIIILNEVIKGVLAGNTTQPLALVHKKTALIFQGGSKWDIAGNDFLFQFPGTPSNP